MNIITVDCGASFIKAALICGGVIKKRKIIQSPPVHNEKNSILMPEFIRSLGDLAKKIIIELSSGQKEVILCVSNEMHGFLLANPDGSPFTDYISWQKEYGSLCVNGERSVDILKKEEYLQWIIYSGMPLRSGLPTSNLLYLNRSGIIDSAKEKLYFYTLGDYIIKYLSGKEPICHITNAAASGFCDLRTQNWNNDLIEFVSDNKIVFPEIGTDEVSFTLDDILIHALPAVGDQQAALLGSGLYDDDTLSFNLGTGAQVSKLISEIDCSETQSYQVRPYFYGKYLKTIPHLPSGRALNVYFNFFKDILNKFNIETTDDNIWKILLDSEKECLETDLAVDLSFFENPVTKNTCGCIQNITENNFDISSLMHSIFHQLAENFLWAANVIQPEKEKINSIIFSGGVAKKIDTIRNLILNNYRSNINITIAQDETLFGLYKYGTDHFL